MISVCGLASATDRCTLSWCYLHFPELNLTVAGNLLAMRNGDLCYLDFGMMSERRSQRAMCALCHQHHASPPHIVSPAAKHSPTAVSGMPF